MGFELRKMTLIVDARTIDLAPVIQQALREQPMPALTPTSTTAKEALYRGLQNAEVSEIETGPNAWKAVSPIAVSDLWRFMHAGRNAEWSFDGRTLGVVIECRGRLRNRRTAVTIRVELGCRDLPGGRTNFFD